MTFGQPPANIASLKYTGDQLADMACVNFPRAPTVYDINYPLFCIWRNSNQSAVLPDAFGDGWILIKFTPNGTNPPSAIWEKFVGAVGPGGDVLSLSDNSDVKTFPDVTGNIKLAAGTGITTISTPASNLITIGLTGGAAAIQQLVPDSGGAVSPVNTPPEQITVHGTAGITTSNGGAGQININAGGTIATSYVTNSGTAIPSGNILNVLGTNAANTTGSGNTVTVNAINTAKWIVDPTSTVGTHTTITAAMAAASSGETIFVRPGTYTEDFTMKPGVDLVAFTGDGYTATVTIVGKITMTGTGRATISNINLTTNSDNFLSITGSNSITLFLINCFFSITNNTGISINNANASLICLNCLGNTTTTGISYFSITSCSNVQLQNCNLANDAFTTTASSIAAGALGIVNSTIFVPLSTSGTGFFNILNSYLDTTVLNVAALTTSGTASTNGIKYTELETGTTTAISVGAGTSISASNIFINDLTTNPVTGAGTFVYDQITLNQGGVLNPSVLTPTDVCIGNISFDGGTNYLTHYSTGTFVPTMVGGTVAGATTYTVQQGYYTRIGNQVTVWGYVAGTAATGTGDALFGALPFTIKNQTNYAIIGSVLMSNAAGWTFPAGTSSLCFTGVSNSTTAKIFVSGSAGASAFLQMANAAFTFQYSLTYQV